VGSLGGGGLPSGVRHDRLGGRHRPSPRGRCPPRPFRRGRHRGRHPVRAGRCRTRLLRAEGRPAGDGHPADGPGLACPRLSSPAPRSASPMGSPLVAQRPPHPRATGRGPGAPPCPAGDAHRARSGGALGGRAAGAHAAHPGGRAARGHRLRLGGRRHDVDRARAGGRACAPVPGGPPRATRLIDNEPIGAYGGPRLSPLGVLAPRGCPGSRGPCPAIGRHRAPRPGAATRAPRSAAASGC